MSRASTPGVVQTLAGENDRRATPIGVDVGSSRYLFAAAAPSDGVDGAATVDAHYAHRLYQEFQSGSHRLGAAPDGLDDSDCLGDLVARYWPRLRQAFEHAADQVIERVKVHSQPVLVLEKLPVQPRPLVDGAYGEVRWATYCPAVAQRILAERAVGVGVPVTYVVPEHTSQVCHRCDVRGDTGGRGCKTLECVNEDCPVGRVCRDRSAAISIAKRAEWRVADRCDGY